MICLFCNQPTVSYLGHKRDVKINRSCNFFRCSKCGFAYTDYTLDWFPQKYLYVSDTYYAITGDEDSANRNKEEKWEHDCKIAEERLNRLLPFVKTKLPVLVDIGCSNGAMPYMARKFGFSSYGFEINKQYPNWDKLKQPYVPIIGLSPDIRWWDACVESDIITFYDVFEHMEDPFICMEQIAEKLAPGGIVVFEQPDPASKQCFEQGLGWKHYRPFQHFYLLSRSNFEHLFSLFGLELVFYQQHMPGRLCVIAKKVA